MKERPIIFSTAMTEALLNTKPDTWPAEPIDPSKPYKWITRRVVKPQPKYPLRQKNGRWHEYSERPMADEICNSPWGYEYSCPFTTGQILWVRETWRCLRVGLAGDTEFAHIGYKCGESKVIEINNGRSLFYTTKAQWKPSIHMPREAARLFLKVESVRIERLQHITVEDVEKEGITIHDLCNKCPPNMYCCNTCGQARHSFSELWDSLNAKRGYSWESNPYVFVYEFMRLDPEKAKAAV